MERPEEEWGDASRRTHLANERTYLAWWRSGLTALAVGLGVGRLIPELTHNHNAVGLGIAGIGFALLGLFFIVYGTYRARAVRRALEEQRFSHPDSRVLLLLAVVGTALGILTLAIVGYSF
jgi:putative membrane protein